MTALDVNTPTPPTTPTARAKPLRQPVFSARARRAKLDRAAATIGEADFLHRRAGEEIADRLESVLKDFPRALFVGAGAPAAIAALTPACGVGAAVAVCESERFLARSGVDAGAACAPDRLPFGDGSFDLVVSSFSLHATDDLPAALREARRVMVPDGLFVALFPGERTLTELRTALRTAETQVTGGLAPRVSPMVAVKDGGALLQSAGFALPVADVVSVPVTYREPLRLWADLRAMGETNAATAGPKGAIRRDVVAAAIAAYSGAKPEGPALATFDLVALTGWSPHESQPKPLKPGSATASLADAVKRA